MNIKNYITDLDRIGYIEIENFLENSKFEELKKQIDKIINNYPNKNFVQTDQKIESSFVKEFIHENKIKETVKEIFNYDKTKFDYEDNFKVLRVLNGKNSKCDKNNFHFDGYYLTLFIPISIPSEISTNNGNFYILPNIRPIFNVKIFDLIVKILFQNKYIKKFYNTNFFEDYFKPKELIPASNKVIIFRGFKSLHGSGKLDAYKKRVGLLYHFKKMK